jgi:hypothetical protein
VRDDGEGAAAAHLRGDGVCKRAGHRGGRRRVRQARAPAQGWQARGAPKRRAGTA